MTNNNKLPRKILRPLAPKEIERMEAFKAQMTAHGMSVKAVALTLHLATSTVYSWRNGRAPMPDRAWLQLQEKLNPAPAPVDMRTVAGSGKVLRLGDSWGVR